MRERERERDTHRQTDRQTDSQPDRGGKRERSVKIIFRVGVGQENSFLSKLKEKDSYSIHLFFFNDFLFFYAENCD